MWVCVCDRSRSEFVEATLTSAHSESLGSSAALRRPESGRDRFVRGMLHATAYTKFTAPQVCHIVSLSAASEFLCRRMRICHSLGPKTATTRTALSVRRWKHHHRKKRVGSVATRLTMGDHFRHWALMQTKWDRPSETRSGVMQPQIALPRALI